MSDKEWRPKVGEQVMIQVMIHATVPREGTADGLVCVQLPCGGHYWFALADLAPLPTPTPREPWDVLREAADECGKHSNAMGGYYPPSVAMMLRVIADALEAAARLKPLPTLAKAVRAYSEKLNSGASEVGAEYATMMEALARTEQEPKA